MGGPVSSLGEEVGKDSTADGGQRDSDLQTPENSIFAYFTRFIWQILFDRFDVLFHRL